MKLFSFSLTFLLLLLHWMFFAYFPFKQKEQEKATFILETCCSVTALIIFIGWLHSY